MSQRRRTRVEWPPQRRRREWWLAVETHLPLVPQQFAVVNKHGQGSPAPAHHPSPLHSTACSFLPSAQHHTFAFAPLFQPHNCPLWNSLLIPCPVNPVNPVNNTILHRTQPFPVAPWHRPACILWSLKDTSQCTSNYLFNVLIWAFFFPSALSQLFKHQIQACPVCTYATHG